MCFGGCPASVSWVCIFTFNICTIFYNVLFIFPLFYYYLICFHCLFPCAFKLGSFMVLRKRQSFKLLEEKRSLEKDRRGRDWAKALWAPAPPPLSGVKKWDILRRSEMTPKCCHTILKKAVCRDPGSGANQAWEPCTLITGYMNWTCGFPWEPRLSPLSCRGDKYYLSPGTNARMHEAGTQWVVAIFFAHYYAN